MKNQEQEYEVSVVNEANEEEKKRKIGRYRLIN
jgi:hypothetical protein